MAVNVTDSKKAYLIEFDSLDFSFFNEIETLKAQALAYATFHDYENSSRCYELIEWLKIKQLITFISEN